MFFKTLRGDIVKLSDKLSAFEKSTEHETIPLINLDLIYNTYF